MSKKNGTNSISPAIANEIQRLAELYSIESEILEKFANFVITNHRQKPAKSKKPKKVKPLTVTQLKKAVYQYFNVNNTTELKKSGRFQLATNDLGKINLSQKKTWEMFYRKYVDILPEEKEEEGKNCINGIDIFKYFRPWDVFGLDPQIATTEDIKSAYRRLAKIYHPDNKEMGNPQIFDRLTIMYESITDNF